MVNVSDSKDIPYPIHGQILEPLNLSIFCMGQNLIDDTNCNLSFKLQLTIVMLLCNNVRVLYTSAYRTRFLQGKFISILARNLKENWKNSTVEFFSLDYRNILNSAITKGELLKKLIRKFLLIFKFCYTNLIIYNATKL